MSKLFIFPRYTFSGIKSTIPLFKKKNNFRRFKVVCVKKGNEWFNGSKISKNVLCFVYYFKRDDHITPFYIRSKENNLIDTRNIKIISLTHRILQN